MSKKAHLKPLLTMAEVDRVLDGTVATARIAGKSAQSISNAKKRGFYPKDTYAVMLAELAARGYWAPASLWRQIEATPAKECA